MKADCPGCGRSNESATDVFWCPICQCQYDDDPDEGGSYANNPLQTLIRREEAEKRRRQRDQRRDSKRNVRRRRKG